jgi:FdhD protein
MPEAMKDAAVIRTTGEALVEDTDRVAVEEPLQVRLHGQPFATIMRTPGSDHALAAGFLLAERVLESPSDLGSIEYCRDAAADSSGNIVNVTIVEDGRARVERALAERRNVTTSAACGMCGRLSIEETTIGLTPLTSRLLVERTVVQGLPNRLRNVQRTFDATGGLHAAGVFAADGRLVASAEDVGRHNAVDKVIGALMMRDELPLSDYLLFVSGRTSFEIVQKAFVAGLPIVAAVSAPSSLAVELATHAGITLLGFVRDAAFNIYSHPQRVT